MRPHLVKKHFDTRFQVLHVRPFRLKQLCHYKPTEER
jgi:hypothetical protein